MAASVGCFSGKDSGTKPSLSMPPPDAIKARYPAVCEEETPLPRQWNPKDKYTYLGLSQSNLRVHYKGLGKNHKDAASVRATYPIPAACGIYYFEVKVISKGREGYMGIGLSTAAVNMNRLPGWEKNSFGYHGDDGNSFCSSGTGKPYGPTFTTGDVVGCCVNLIEGTCFYTKNGVNLGIVFRGLPPNLYPTVGLQTPGEIVEANFGQNPFVFDIEDYMQEWKLKTKNAIESFAVSNKNGEWQIALQRVISSYLIHNGYCSTAEAFAQSTGQSFEEELASIRNRQRIQKLILCGQIGDAIDTTTSLYPELLQHNPNLLFRLKCRQFVEMVNGTDLADPPPSLTPSSCISYPSEYSVRVGSGNESTRERSRSRSHSSTHNGTTNSSSVDVLNSSECLEDSIDDTIPNRLSDNFTSNSVMTNDASVTGSNVLNGSYSNGTHSVSNTSVDSNQSVDVLGNGSNVMNNATNSRTFDVDDMDTSESVANGDTSLTVANGNTPSSCETNNGTRHCVHDSEHSNSGISVNDDVEMEMDLEKSAQGVLNGSSLSTRTIPTGGSNSHVSDSASKQNDSLLSASEPVDDRTALCTTRLDSMTEANLQRILEFGRELHAMAGRLYREYGANESNEKILKDAVSLLAYSDPRNSSVGYQLHPTQREPICAALNSAILELQGLPKQPPLELAISHAHQCIKLMSKSGIGSCAFANVSDYLHTAH